MPVTFTFAPAGRSSPSTFQRESSTCSRPLPSTMGSFSVKVRPT